MAETWLDTRTGDLLIGQAAISQRLEESSPGDLRPLAELITAKTLDFDTSHFDRPKRKVWKEAELLEYGAWISHVLYEYLDDSGLKRRHWDAAFELKLGPSYEVVNYHVGEMWKLRKKLGQDRGRTHKRFFDWTSRDFAQYARRVEKIVGDKPKREDYRDYAAVLDGPNEYDIHERAGGVRQLNDLIGYPDIYSWDKEDYIAWGVKMMIANDGQLPRQRTIDVISKRKRGPSSKIIAHIDHFGSLNSFQKAVSEAYQYEMEDVELRQERKQELFKPLHDVPMVAEWLKENPEASQPLFLAKYLLSKACLLGKNPDQLVKVADTAEPFLVKALQRRDSSLTAGYIEMRAVALDVFDDIWPPDESWREYLKVDKQEDAQSKSTDDNELSVA